MERNDRTAGLIAAALAVALLPVVYTGAYYAMVEPVSGKWINGEDWVAAYRYGGRSASRFFYPAHQLDRWIRPGFWGE